MSLHSNLNQDIVVLTPSPGEEDIYGNTTPGEPTEATHKGLTWQGESTETRDLDGNTIITDWHLLIVATSGITARARVRAQGRTFEVIGHPQQVSRPGSPPVAYQALLRLEEEVGPDG